MAATAPYPAVKPRTPSRLGAFASRIQNEFALRPHRVRSALRSATIGAIGAGIMTAAHIASPLGPYVVWMLAGTPTSMMSWRIAVIFTVAEAALIAASVIVARTLSQSPPLMLLFLGAFGFAATYLVNRYKLGSFGIIGEVLVLDNLYGVMFAPEQLGWRAGSGFAAVAVAIGLLALFDNLLWPDPADAILLESLAANLCHIRLRILESTRYYLDEHRGPIPPKIANWRELSGRLTLLARAQAEGISEHRRGVLLAIITRVARIESESDVIALLAAENRIAGAAGALLFPEIEAVVEAIGAALDEVANDPATMLRTGPDDSPAPAATQVTAVIRMLDSRIEEQRPNYIKRVDATELTNLSAFLSSLRAIARLIERPLDEPAAAPEGGRATASADDTGSGLEHYSLKVAISVVAAFVLGLASQRADLSTIMTTVIIAGLPTYGASRRKMNLRIIGSVLGGAITVAAIIITTPNFETLPSYIMVFFVVLLISAYAGQGSERIAYAGKQIGTTMALVFVGLSPSTAIDAPLWRIWGILLGTSVVALVFLFLWPEYSGKSLLPRLRKALGLAIMLDPREGLSEVMIRQRDAELAGLLEQLLAIAEDARMEGRASGLNPDAVINAAGNLRRVAHRFERIALIRMRQPRPQLDRETEALEEAALGGIVKQLEAWHAHFVYPDLLEGDPSMPNSTESITVVLENFSARVEADSFARLANWDTKARRTLLAELQSLRRLDFLMTELNNELSRIVQQTKMM